VQALRFPPGPEQVCHPRTAQGRPVRQGQPGLRRAPAGQVGGRGGRRARLRVGDRPARGGDRGLHDRAL